jgi:hypothetical protein
VAFVIADRVKETSTTTGTGALTLAGAATGFRAMSAVLSVGDTVFYTIEAVDAGGLPTGDWEVGLGTYSGSNTLTRTTVLSSSNANAAVSLAAGTKNVFITVPATHAAWMRDKLNADRDYYVRTDGSNSNTGLANTSGAAFLTLQKAADVVGALDLNGFTATVHVADGTYTGGVVLPNYVGSGLLAFVGNTSTPANCIISTTSADCFSGQVAKAFTTNGFKVQSATSGVGIVAANGAKITHSNMVFGACASGHVQSSSGGVITATTNYTISGAAPFHVIFAEGGVVIITGRTLTITGTPAFTAFCFGRNPSSFMADGCTFTGSATGSRYSLTNGASAYVAGASSTYLPGNSAGTLGSAGSLGLYG